MSFKVLVVPEDHTYNGAILKPLIEGVLLDVGKSSAMVKVLDNPRVQGFDQAMAAIKGELVDRYRWMDLWLFMPDADKRYPPGVQAGHWQEGLLPMPAGASPEAARTQDQYRRFEQEVAKAAKQWS